MTWGYVSVPMLTSASGFFLSVTLINGIGEKEAMETEERMEKTAGKHNWWLHYGITGELTLWDKGDYNMGRRRGHFFSHVCPLPFLLSRE